MKQVNKLIRWQIAAILILLTITIVWQRTFVSDLVRAFSYSPDQATVAIGKELRLTWLGEMYFRASRPVIDSTNRASTHCHVEKSSAILGCYANGIIYIYDIDNSELKGVEEVTAAHEVLHAAYERLSDGERERIGAILRNQQQLLDSDSAFSERISVYGDLNEADFIDELHSIIGTEVETIIPELEEYYAKYFNDRDRIVNHHKQYSAVFFKLQADIESAVNQYNTLMLKRNDRIQDVNDAYSALEQEIATVKQQPATSDQVAAINRKINDYNAMLRDTRRVIQQYDTRLTALKSKIDEASLHQQVLDRTLDSSLAPAPQL